MEPLGGHQLNAGSRTRSRKWVIAIILLSVIAPIIMTVGITALVFGGLYFGSKSTEEYICAMSELKKNDQAFKVLGKPIEDGYFVVPNIEISGPIRRVNFSIPVSGAKGAGSLQVISFRDGFNSQFMMTLKLDKRDDPLILYRGSYPCTTGAEHTF